MTKSILVVKETRAGETRVSLTPADAKKLIETNEYHVFIESNAGAKAGFTNTDYESVGCEIRVIKDSSLLPYQDLFKNIDIIVRAKRPERQREILENQAIQKGTILIGALDPLEKNSTHIQEYKDAGIIAYSIDQLPLETNDPMNVLAAMSQIAGRLALLDALEKFQDTAKKVVIIGFGVVGQAALKEALDKNLNVTVVIGNKDKFDSIKNLGAKAFILVRNQAIEFQQDSLVEILSKADIVITSARKANEKAPLLIPATTLHKMQKGSIIVDMALSEGGNVEGSEHDASLTLGNGVIVTNISGYPKFMPKEASELWSRASRLFILKLNTKQDSLLPCIC